MSVCLQCTYSLKWARANECKRAEFRVQFGEGGRFALKRESWYESHKRLFTEKVRNKRSWIHGVNCWSLFLSASRLPFSCSLVKQLKHENSLLPFSISSNVTERETEPWVQLKFLHHQLQASVLCLKWSTGEAAKWNILGRLMAFTLFISSHRCLRYFYIYQSMSKGHPHHGSCRNQSKIIVIAL